MPWQEPFSITDTSAARHSGIQTGIVMAKQIISVSRRTDIPAFYAEWFMGRVRALYCMVPNPFNQNQVSRVSLKPSDVTAFVFWTRNPKPFMKYLRELDQMGFHYYFQYTIIGYPREIDPYSPAVEEGIQALRELSSMIGRNRVVWRYDPILLSDTTSYKWHEERLSYLIDELKNHTKRLVISFVDPYGRSHTRLSDRINDTGVRLAPDAFEPEAYRGLAEFIGGEAAKAGIEVRTCAEAADLSQYGIYKGKCVDDELISAITGDTLKLQKDPSQRKLCGCVVSKDIGVNNTCLFGCAYCYATSNIGAAEINYKKHDPASPSLI